MRESYALQGIFKTERVAESLAPRSRQESTQCLALQNPLTMARGRGDAAVCRWDDLPTELVCRILRALAGVHDIVAAISAHRMFHVAAADPSLWEGVASRWHWRLRAHDAEGPREFCARSHAGAQEQRLLFIGDISSPSHSVDAFSPRTRTFSEPAASPRDDSAGQATSAGAVAVGSNGTEVCVVGGYAEERPLSLATHYSQRHPLPALPRALCFGAAHVDSSNRLWHAGGGSSIFRGAAVEASVQMLPPGQVAAQWVSAGHLCLPRCGHALASDGRTSLLYSVGGYGGGQDANVFDVGHPQYGGYHDTVETFDMQTGRATVLPQRMSSARTGVGAASGADGCIYVVGGSTDGEEMLASCERYDPRRGVWQPLPPLPSARGYLAATFGLDGVLYVAGGSGNDGYSFLSGSSFFAAFDPRRSAWEMLPPLPSERSCFQMALSLGSV
jgi:hypothetical protein